MIPTRIELTVNPITRMDELAVTWDDGHKGVISLKTLRESCPCAGCKGETILFRTYAPTPQSELPGKYKMVGAQPVGSYALGVSWADGHQTGIYPWEMLRDLCECDTCAPKT